MKIRNMTREECFQFLSKVRVGRLACARENEPYIVPVFFAYNADLGGKDSLYGFTTFGQKVRWMRANPRVCLEADDVNSCGRWTSVIVDGRYEELSGFVGQDHRSLQYRSTEDSLGESSAGFSEDSDERHRAWSVLKMHPMWQEPACSAWAKRADHTTSEIRNDLVFYRIRVQGVSGREAISEDLDGPASVRRKDGAPGSFRASHLG